MVVGVLLSVLSTLLSVISLSFFYPFVSDWPIPKTVSNGYLFSLLSDPLANNLLLIAIFVVQHSIMARESVQQPIKSFIPNGSYGAIFGIFSSLCLLLLCLAWVPMHATIWSLMQWKWLAYTIKGINLIAILGLIYIVCLTAPLELLGSQILLSKVFGWKPKKQELLTSGLYSMMRHPMMTCLLLIIWTVPEMTHSHFLLAGALTIYIVFSVILFEEPKLIAEYGNSYKKYIDTVPRFIPGIRLYGIN